MLLKRSIVLAAGVLLFIVAFILYFDFSHMRMEKRFQEEREKFGVQGAILTAAEPAAPPTPSPAPPAPAPASDGASDTNAPVSTAPPAADATVPDHTAIPATSDTNSSPASSTPDTNAAPASTPDSNAAPAAPPVPPPSSTIYVPARSSVFQLASFRPLDGFETQMADAGIAQVASTPPETVKNPVTNTPARETNVAPTPAQVSANKTPGVAISAGNPIPSHSTAGEGKVIVLLYHQFKAPGVKIPPMFQWTMNSDVFESEMKYIHDNGYHVIPMSDLLKFLRHEITVPPNSVCITIDDGYKSAIVYAYPILKKYGFPWTFFIYPDFITTGEGPGAASWNDLLALQKDGVDIESHSMTHPNLKLHHQKVKGVWHNFTPDEYAQWLTNETAGAKALLEQKMGKPIVCFAYPYGEYNKQVQDAAIAAGYEAIFTVADNPVHSSTNMHSIGRYTITQGVEKNFDAYLRQGALGIDAAEPAPGDTITDPRPVITARLGYAGTLDPTSIETQVRDFGDVRHDFDPQTNTVRLYLPRDLISPVVLVNIRVKDAATGQFMVADWHFNYEPANATIPVHPPIAPATNAPAASANATPPPLTNAPAKSEPAPAEKSAASTPVSLPPAVPASPAPSTSNTSTRD